MHFSPSAVCQALEATDRSAWRLGSNTILTWTRYKRPRGTERGADSYPSRSASRPPEACAVRASLLSSPPAQGRPDSWCRSLMPVLLLTPANTEVRKERGVRCRPAWRRRAYGQRRSRSMLPLDYLLAAVLLTAPVGAAEPPDFPELYPALRLPLQALAVTWEILDPREVRFILARPEDFGADLTLLRRRYHELIAAPAVDAALRFPERAAFNEFLSYNRAYRQHIDVRQPLELVHWWELRVALQETDRLYLIWDKVRDARCSYYYVTVRRQALKDLRELVGEEAYYSGRLPPCVPLWHFREAYCPATAGPLTARPPGPRRRRPALCSSPRRAKRAVRGANRSSRQTGPRARGRPPRFPRRHLRRAA